MQADLEGGFKRVSGLAKRHLYSWMGGSLQMLLYGAGEQNTSEKVGRLCEFEIEFLR